MNDPGAADSLPVAESVAGSLISQGAEAVALVGSWATGTALSKSDIDLAVVGDGPHYRLEAHDGFIVSIGWASEEDQRRRLYDPNYLGTHVTGWQQAVPLLDPNGTAVSIKEEALAWSWSMVANACDRWAAESLTGLAEEVVKLTRFMRDEHPLGAAVQRSVLSLRLAKIMALHERILYNSENNLWRLVSDALGPEWARTQAAALGLDSDPESSCVAALRLFSLALVEVGPLLDDRQRAVVDLADGPGS